MSNFVAKLEVSIAVPTTSLSRRRRYLQSWSKIQDSGFYVEYSCAISFVFLHVHFSHLLLQTFQVWICTFLLSLLLARKKKEEKYPKKKEITRTFSACKYFSAQFTCHLQMKSRQAKLHLKT